MNAYVDTRMPITMTPIELNNNSDNPLSHQQSSAAPSQSYASQQYTAPSQSYSSWNMQSPQNIISGFASSNSASMDLPDRSGITVQQQQQQQQPVIQMQIPPRTTTATNNTQTELRSQTMQSVQLIRWAQRPKFATSYWEEEGTLCYQVDANSVCVARRQDNDMVNGTKLLNVTGMSRGKRDGILKNEHARVVVKVGPMHLKGVWITFTRAKQLAEQFKITESLNPLFLEDPSVYFQAQHQAPSVQFMPPNQTGMMKSQKQVQNQFESRMFERCEPSKNNATSFQSAPLVRSMEPSLVEVETPLPINDSYITSKSDSNKGLNGIFPPYYNPCNNIQSRIIPVQNHHMYSTFDAASPFNINQDQFNYSPNNIIDFGDSPPPQITGHGDFNHFDSMANFTNVRRLDNQYIFSSDHPPSSGQSTGIHTNSLYTPTISENSSAPPTPTDPSLTFQLDQQQQQAMIQQQQQYREGQRQIAQPLQNIESYPHHFPQQDNFHLYGF